MDLFFRFHGDLPILLRSGLSGRVELCHNLDRRASIKDIIESLGIPHPEIASLAANGHEISFAYIPEQNDRVDVVPLTPPVDVFTPTILRPQPLQDIRFVVDVNVGKLASLLRMAGIDTVYENSLTDTELAGIAAGDNRILLTRDCRLLQRKIVEFGHLVRSENPARQLAEVLHLYGLAGKLKPFSRCLRCNGILEPVAKERIMHRLEPLTKKYYDAFHQCRGCDRIYWAGSHREKMQGLLEGI